MIEKVGVHCCLQVESPLLWVLILEEAQWFAALPRVAPPLRLAHRLRKAPVGSSGPPSEAGDVDNTRTDLFGKALAELGPVDLHLV